MKTVLLITLTLFSSSLLADAAQSVSIQNPFARAAIQQQRNSAVFMQITNHGIDSAIHYAKSPAAKIVELHTHINDNGVMRMRKIPQIELPAHLPVALQPGGLHIMLLGLNQDLKPGDKIEVTLGFSDGSEKPIEVPVQNMMMPNNKHMKGHTMDGSLPSLVTH